MAICRDTRKPIDHCKCARCNTQLKLVTKQVPSRTKSKINNG